MREEMVVSPDLTPDWFEKYLGIEKELGRQLLRGLRVPGEGLSLEHLQALVEHRNPFAKTTFSAITYADRLVLKTAQLLSRRFGKKIVVDPLPEWFTEENLRKAKKFNLMPIFLPDEEIGEDQPLRNWIKPRNWFYDQIENGKIANDSAQLKRGWYLADFTIGADYNHDKQVFRSDPLSPIIARLRQEGRVGKNDKTPMGSRFTIAPEDEWPLLIAILVDEELKISSYKERRLERAIEFNAIGNLYDKNRGQFNIWEWFADAFGDSRRLHGGPRDCGGLASIDCHWADFRGDSVAGRPLVSF